MNYANRIYLDNEKLTPEILNGIQDDIINEVIPHLEEYGLQFTFTKHTYSTNEFPLISNISAIENIIDTMGQAINYQIDTEYADWYSWIPKKDWSASGKKLMGAEDLNRWSNNLQFLDAYDTEPEPPEPPVVVPPLSPTGEITAEQVDEPLFVLTKEKKDAKYRCYIDKYAGNSGEVGDMSEAISTGRLAGEFTTLTVNRGGRNYGLVGSVKGTGIYYAEPDALLEGTGSIKIGENANWHLIPNSNINIDNIMLEIPYAIMTSWEFLDDISYLTMANKFVSRIRIWFEVNNSSMMFYYDRVVYSEDLINWSPAEIDSHNKCFTYPIGAIINDAEILPLDTEYYNDMNLFANVFYSGSSGEAYTVAYVHDDDKSGTEYITKRQAIYKTEDGVNYHIIKEVPYMYYDTQNGVVINTVERIGDKIFVYGAYKDNGTRKDALFILTARNNLFVLNDGREYTGGFYNNNCYWFFTPEGIEQYDSELHLLTRTQIEGYYGSSYVGIKGTPIKNTVYFIATTASNNKGQLTYTTYEVNDNNKFVCCPPKSTVGTDGYYTVKAL